MKNLIGIDYGKKKIGIAFAPEGTLALGLKIIPNDRQFSSELTQIVKELQIEKFVVGIPLNMNGTKSPQTLKALVFVNKLKQEFPKISVSLYDERLTSIEAKKNIAKNLLDDAEAARIILQGYIDKQKNKKNVPLK